MDTFCLYLKKSSCGVSIHFWFHFELSLFWPKSRFRVLVFRCFRILETCFENLTLTKFKNFFMHLLILPKIKYPPGTRARNVWKKNCIFYSKPRYQRLIHLFFFVLQRLVFEIWRCPTWRTFFDASYFFFHKKYLQWRQHEFFFFFNKWVCHFLAQFKNSSVSFWPFSYFRDLNSILTLNNFKNSVLYTS